RLSDVFHMIGTDSYRSLQASFETIAQAEQGVVLYMEQAHGSRELLRVLDAKPNENLAPMSFRDYGIGAQILVELGLCKIRLLSNSQRKVVGLDGYGLEIVEQIAL